MSTELIYLLLTAVLAASLWIPYIVGVNTLPNHGARDPFYRPPDLTTMPAWVHRAHRAHLNLIEQMLPFAVVVLVASHLAVSTPVTAGAAVAFFWLRLAHAVGMISGHAGFPARPILFTLGWLAICTIAVQVLLVA